MDVAIKLWAILKADHNTIFTGLHISRLTVTFYVLISTTSFVEKDKFSIFIRSYPIDPWLS
jgi:hypothetical protein